MATTYVRRFDLKNSPSDSEVVSFWNFMTQEFVLLLDPGLRALIGRFYGALDLRTSTQTWLREITPELIRAIGS
jgi:hypothetical protein